MAVDDAARTPSALSLEIAEGAIHAFFVYDVADTIDLTRVDRATGEGLARAPLSLRREVSPGSVQFPTPPLIMRLPGATVDGHAATTRAKLFDYGVVSIRLTFASPGGWADFARAARMLRASETPAAAGRAALDRLLAEIAPALDDPHEPLVEDYYIFEVTRFATPVSALDLLGRSAPALTALIAAEDRTLGEEERNDLLRSHVSYFDDDLVVVHWDAAFVYDDAEAAAAAEDILEFANTQLVELRTYDSRLDAELDAIYASDGERRSFGPLARRAAFATAERLRYLIVDVLELTDRSSNALKITGDAYYARLYRAASKRLGLGDWQRLLDAKLQTVNEMYRFSADDAQNARAQYLELIIIVLIGVEIVIGILTLLRGL